MKRTLLLSIIILLVFSSCKGKVDVLLDTDYMIIKSKFNYTDNAKILQDDFNKVLKDEIVLIDEQSLIINDSELESLNDYNLLSPVFTKNIDDNEKTITYHVSITNDNYLSLAKIWNIIEDENVIYYTAKYNQNESKESYLKIIDFVFGTSIKNDFSVSNIDISIKSNKKIVSTTNAKIINEYEAMLSVDAVSFALLKEPITATIVVDNS